MSTNSSPNPASGPPPAPGALIGGRYVVEGVLGQGGSGVVLAALDGDRPCAVKLYHQGRSSLLQRFHREREALLHLRHPGVVVAFDAGWHGDTPYLVMERVQGRPPAPLRQELPPWTEGPAHPALVEAARPILRLLDILEAVHAQGWVHRDLSPANLLVEASGRVRLLDLGLAVPSGEGLRMGTWGWMAPEQALGRETGPAADLYSCGALLYHLLTGAAPWRGLRGAELLRLQLTGALVPPSERNPAIPAPLSAAILALMSPNPAGRPPDAASARRLLTRALEGDAEPREHSTAACWRWVGRQTEQALLDQALGEALRGDITRPLLFLGEAGIGKTRLLDELTTLALGRGVQPLRLPRGPSLLEQARAALGLWRGDEGAAAAPTRDTEALAAVRAALLDRAPAALLLDDLHRDHALGLALLAQPPLPGVLLVGTSRGDIPVELEPRVHTTVLRPLGEAELAELVDGDGTLARLLLAVSDGNPLLAQEALRGWRSAGRAWREAGRWVVDPELHNEADRGAAMFIPDRFAGWLRQRAASAGDEALRLLEVLAALGGQATWPMLLATGVAAEEGAARAALTALERAHLVVEVEDEPPRFRLLHPMATDVLTQDLRPATLRRWCARAVDAEPTLPRAWQLRLLHRAGRIYDAAHIELEEAEALEQAGDLERARVLYTRIAGCLAGDERARAAAGAARCGA